MLKAVKKVFDKLRPRSSVAQQPLQVNWDAVSYPGTPPRTKQGVDVYAITSKGIVPLNAKENDVIQVIHTKDIARVLAWRDIKLLQAKLISIRIREREPDCFTMHMIDMEIERDKNRRATAMLERVIAAAPSKPYHYCEGCGE